MNSPGFLPNITSSSSSSSPSPRRPPPSTNITSTTSSQYNDDGQQQQQQQQDHHHHQTSVKMHFSGATLPKMESILHIDGAISDDHHAYQSFKPRQVLSGWKTAQHAQEEKQFQSSSRIGLKVGGNQRESASSPSSNGSSPTQQAGLKNKNNTSIKKTTSTSATATGGGNVVKELKEWTPERIMTDVFTAEQRSLIHSQVEKFLQEMSEYAIKALPPVYSEDLVFEQEGTTRTRTTASRSGLMSEHIGASSFNTNPQLHLRKILPPLQRKMLAVNPFSSSSSSQTKKNTTQAAGGGDTELVMSRYAPEWLVNGRSLHHYALENLDTLLIRSFMSIPDMPHIRHILMFHLNMEPRRIAALLHKGFGASRAELEELLFLQAVVEKRQRDERENKEIRGETERNRKTRRRKKKVKFHDDDDGDENENDDDEEERYDDDDDSSSEDENEEEEQQQDDNNKKKQELEEEDEKDDDDDDIAIAKKQIAELQQKQLNSSQNQYSNLQSLCLSFCKLEATSAQFLFEWASFSPTAKSLTSLDISHNHLQNYSVPQILRMIARGTLLHLNLRGNSRLFSVSQTSSSNFENDSDNKKNSSSSSSSSPTKNYSKLEEEKSSYRSRQSSVFSPTSSFASSQYFADQNAAAALSTGYYPVTPAQFLLQSKDNLVTLELSLTGIVPDHVNAIVHSVQQYNFVSLSLDGMDMTTKNAATLLECVKSNINIVHCSLKFVATCSSKVFQERLNNVLQRNMELYYDAKVLTPLRERFGDAVVEYTTNEFDRINREQQQQQKSDSGASSHSHSPIQNNKNNVLFSNQSSQFSVQDTTTTTTKNTTSRKKVAMFEKVPTRSILKLAQRAFWELQPMFSTGTPPELLQLVEKSSLAKSLKGQLVSPHFSNNDNLSDSSSGSGNNTSGSFGNRNFLNNNDFSLFGSKLSRGTLLQQQQKLKRKEEKEQQLDNNNINSQTIIEDPSLSVIDGTTTLSANFGSLVMKNATATDVAAANTSNIDNSPSAQQNKNKNASSMLMRSTTASANNLSPEIERQIYISSALPPGYSTYTTNDPSRMLERLQQVIYDRVARELEQDHVKEQSTRLYRKSSKAALHVLKEDEKKQKDSSSGMMRNESYLLAGIDTASVSSSDTVTTNNTINTATTL